jgi:localization factor PodJL
LAPAQYRLGGMYEKGQGVAKDMEAARRWYERAAQAGHVKAMHNLAVLHAEGGLGAPDYTTAAYWFGKAAERGLVDSQYNLAVLTVRGLGVKRDFAAAYRWFALAADQGDADAAGKRDAVAAKMSPADLASAKLSAQSFQVLPADPQANEVAQPAEGWDAALPRSARKTK